MNQYLEEYLADWFLINSREEEEIDLREDVKAEFIGSWGMWLVSYVDEDGDDGSVLLRDAKSAEEALLIGASLVKEHGFIPDEMFYPAGEEM